MNSNSSIPGKMYAVLILSACIVSCSKKENSPADPCAGKTITITPTVVDATACSTGGSITIAAAGSDNFMYKLNNDGTYQSSNIFNGVNAGTYTVFVKDGAGCEKSTSVTVNSAG